VHSRNRRKDSSLEELASIFDEVVSSSKQYPTSARNIMDCGSENRTMEGGS